MITPVKPKSLQKLNPELVGFSRHQAVWMKYGTICRYFRATFDGRILEVTITDNRNEKLPESFQKVLDADIHNQRTADAENFEAKGELIQKFLFPLLNLHNVAIKMMSLVAQEALDNPSPVNELIFKWSSGYKAEPEKPKQQTAAFDFSFLNK